MNQEDKRKDPENVPEEEQQAKEELFPEDLPPASFIHIAQTFGVQALIHLGKLPFPGSEQPEINLKMAQFNIDLLEILQEKTKGNLTPEEEKLIEELLHVTRITFVEVKKAEDK